MNFKYKFQKGLSLVEGMTAAGVLGIAITVFMTLQSYQERDFANLRKFDKAAYAVELMFEELAAVYNPVAKQYGNPAVFEDTTAGTSLKVKGLVGITENDEIVITGDQIIIEGVGGRYEITAATDLDGDNNSTLTLERSDVPEDTVNKNMASDATENASITFVSNQDGSLYPYDNLDMKKFEDTVYLDTLEPKVSLDCANWGALLEKHLGPARNGDKRLLEVEDIEVDVPVDKDNDGITDQVDGEDVYETVKKIQVTIIIKQDKIEEKFRRIFLAGT
tara:strand:- start:361 stop:1191 length:831 start_codon:yes stop_codon:yes gene_type:complete